MLGPDAFIGELGAFQRILCQKGCGNGLSSQVSALDCSALKSISGQGLIFNMLSFDTIVDNVLIPDIGRADMIFRDSSMTEMVGVDGILLQGV